MSHDDGKRLYVNWRHYRNNAHDLPDHYPLEDGDTLALAALVRIAQFNGMRLAFRYDEDDLWRVELQDWNVAGQQYGGVCSVVVRRAWSFAYALERVVDMLHAFDTAHGTYHETFELKPSEPTT